MMWMWFGNLMQPHKLGSLFLGKEPGIQLTDRYLLELDRIGIPVLQDNCFYKMEEDKL